MESKKAHRAGEDRVLERYNALKLGWLNDSLFFSYCSVSLSDLQSWEENP